MAIKVYKKNTAGRRNMSIVKPDNLTDKKPEKNLLAPMTQKGGRSHGKFQHVIKVVGTKDVIAWLISNNRNLIFLEKS